MLFPLWAWIGPYYEESGFHDEIEGLAAGLGVPPADVLRALFALSGGSTVFAATRSATADGAALIGRNVDWADGMGARRPLVLDVHPSNGDLAHLFVGWPLVGLPAVGLNEAGFALSLNFFVADPQVGLLLPQWPHRRALQRAHDVAEGIEIFQQARLRGHRRLHRDGGRQRRDRAARVPAGRVQRRSARTATGSRKRTTPARRR